MKRWHDLLPINIFYNTLERYIGETVKGEVDENFLDFLLNTKLKDIELDMILEQIVSNSELKKNYASYYTPNDILEIFKIRYEEKDVINVLEPSVGAGQLLIDLLKNDKSKTKLNITCYDISLDAILCTKFRLKLNNLCNSRISYTFINKDFLTHSLQTKFDLIICNPPYYEVKKSEYNNIGLSYAKGNIYTYFMEKSLNLLDITGSMYFIVPYSLVCTQRMIPIKNYMENNFSRIEYRNFADRPSSLFPKAHQKITLFSGIRKKENNVGNVFMSEYLHFFKNERQHKFLNITLYSNKNKAFRFSNPIEEKIVNKISKTPQVKLKNKGKYSIFINPRACFWMKVFLDSKSATYKEYFLETEDDKIYTYAFLNSSLFYFLWHISGDGWHVTNKDLTNIYISSKVNIDILRKLNNDLIENLERDKVYIGSKQVDYQYKHKFSKKIIDEIDTEICGSLGLTEKELEYIKKFNLKYRMGDNVEST